MVFWRNEDEFRTIVTINFLHISNIVFIVNWSLPRSGDWFKAVVWNLYAYINSEYIGLEYVFYPYSEIWCLNVNTAFVLYVFDSEQSLISFFYLFFVQQQSFNDLKHTPFLKLLCHYRKWSNKPPCYYATKTKKTNQITECGNKASP